MVVFVGFYIRCILLGVSLAMDACAVSMANGLKYPQMKKSESLFSCLLFGLFQGGMPLIGYFAGHAIFKNIEHYIPYIALVVLCVLGINMILGSFHSETYTPKQFKIKESVFQAIATSLDALTVGFTIANYNNIQALECVSIIAGSTMLLCLLGYRIGKKFGTRLGAFSEILGGAILIGIGIEIFLKGM